MLVTRGETLTKLPRSAVRLADTSVGHVSRHLLAAQQDGNLADALLVPRRERPRPPRPNSPQGTANRERPPGSRGIANAPVAKRHSRQEDPVQILAKNDHNRHASGPS